MNFLLGKSAGVEFPEFLFIWQCLNFSFIFEWWTCWIRNFNWQSFSSLKYFEYVSTLISGLHSSDAKWDVSEDPLNMINHFSLAAFKSISLSLSFRNLSIMCRCESLCIYPTWCMLSSLDIWINQISSNLGIFQLLFLQLFLLTLSFASRVIIAYMLICLMVSHWFLRVFIFILLSE